MARPLTKSPTISIRLSLERFAVVEAAAKLHGETPSEYVARKMEEATVGRHIIVEQPDA